MGGSSKSSTTTNIVRGPFDGVEPSKTSFRKEPSWFDIAIHDHRGHVEKYIKHQRWINRPWTWRNYLAAAINAVIRWTERND